MADEQDPPQEIDERPRGLLGLMLWPLQQLLLGGIRLAVGLVGGIVAALFSGLIPGARLPSADDEAGDAEE